MLIVGMGGLAQAINNDERVKDHFKIYMKWLSVVEYFEPEDLIRKLLREPSHHELENHKLGILQETLKNEVRIRDFYLFLMMFGLRLRLRWNGKTYGFLCLLGRKQVM